MPDRQFAIQRLYIKDVSFESPNAPQIFLEDWEPEVNVEMDNAVTTIDEAGVYDVQLKVTVTAKLGEQIAYIAEAVQGGIFLASGFEEDERLRITGAVCPETLYPYLRQVISETISQGSFPPFFLTPINFDMLYQKRLQKQQLADQAPASSAIN